MHQSHGNAAGREGAAERNERTGARACTAESARPGVFAPVSPHGISGTSSDLCRAPTNCATTTAASSASPARRRKNGHLMPRLRAIALSRPSRRFPSLGTDAGLSSDADADSTSSAPGSHRTGPGI